MAARGGLPDTTSCMSLNPSPRDGWLRGLTFALAILSFLVVLAAHHISDGDLWGKLAIGAHVWKFGDVPQHDMFAFTPVLPRYIEHEWGAGTIFFGVLKFFGSPGLMVLKILLAFSAMAAALATGRRLGASWNALLLLAIPVAASLLPGYIPVIRSHAFTYCFFAITLFSLEELRNGKLWPAFILPPETLVWSNIHGGFVAGLGAMLVYTCFAFLPASRSQNLGTDSSARRGPMRMLLVTIICAATTLVNIYGLKFWAYLIPALLNKRPFIAEWQPLPLFALDPFLGFRILFVLVTGLLLATWRRTVQKSWPGLIMLAVTAGLAWHSRRHAPFFAVTTLAFVGPFAQSALSSLRMLIKLRLQPKLVVLACYGAVAIYAATVELPQASFDVLAPIGHDPVREVDILSRAKATGNLATPFGWGCYCSWRLYPRIKISMDGRYETTYPESTFEMNGDFYARHGTNWDRLIRNYTVDYVILEFTQTRLRPRDLLDHGYDLIWETKGHSALMALQKHAATLRKVAAALPPTTINPLDATITDKWWTH